VNCGNTGFDYAKQRETTCEYASGVDGIKLIAGPVVIDVRMAAVLPAVEHGRECGV
jgi:hypothetical protein